MDLPVSAAPRTFASRTASVLALGLLAGCPASPAADVFDGSLDSAADAAPDASIDVADAEPPWDARAVPPGLGGAVRRDGRIDLSVDTVPFDGIEFVVRYADGHETLLSSMVLFDASGSSITGRDLTGIEVRIEFRAAPFAGRGGAALHWTIRGPADVLGVELRFPVAPLPPGAFMFVDGAQSWSFSGPLSLPPNTLLPRDAGGRIRWPTVIGNVVEERAGMSFLRAEIAWPAGGLAVCATAPYDRWLGISLERPGTAYQLRVTDGLQPDERVVLADSTQTLSGSFVLARRDPAQPFICQRAARPPARTRGTRPFPRGWWSWNTLFSNVTSSRIDAQWPLLSALDPRATHVTVDDGWERAWGDWRESPAFGTTLADLATRLRADGRTLGLWLAPFLVDPSAPIFTLHPEWFVHDNAGAVITDSPAPGRRYAMLDATHPDVRTYLRELFRDLRSRGVQLFKIDFLFAGARVGVRYDRSATGLQAYRLGLQAIADGSGDAHINGCGAFVFPSIPYVDSMRVGADATYSSVTPFWGAVIATARNVAVRADIADYGVTSDSDQPVVREFNPDEGRAFVATGLLAFGSFGYGDDLATLDPGRRGVLAEAWVARLRDRAEGNAVALPPDAEDISDVHVQNPLFDAFGSFRARPQARSPHIFVVDVGDVVWAVVVFNWFGERELGVPGSIFAPNAALREWVTDAPVSRNSDGSIRIRVPAHGVRVVVGNGN